MEKIELKICSDCSWIKISNPTPDGDEICPNCGMGEMGDYEQDDVSRIISKLKADIKDTILRKLPKKMTMGTALKTNSDAGAGYTIGYNSLLDEVRNIIKDLK